jgi:isopenicillin N synthase-like dioxygenase
MTSPRPKHDFSHVPVIDIGPLIAGAPARAEVAEQLGTACRECGFFYVVGHGVAEELGARLERLSREFFRWDQAEKMRSAWRTAGGLRILSRRRRVDVG